jgi:pectinesterase
MNKQKYMTCKRLTLVILVAISSLFALPAPARAQDIFIAGDSTASEYGPERYPRMGWGQVLGDFYGTELKVFDLAKSGRSARSFISEGFFADLEKQLGPDDILLIQFAHNDQKIDSPDRYAPAETTFKEYLRKYLSLASDKGAKAVLLTPVVRRNFRGGALIPTHGKYPAAIRDLAIESGVPLIDMTVLSGQFIADLGAQKSKDIYLHLTTARQVVEDNTHFSEQGAYAMAAFVARELDRLQVVPHHFSAPNVVQVESDGSGDFIRIQDAINSLEGTAKPATILIGPGDFEEKLFLTRDNITLSGAGRDKTIIRTTELRANWRKTHDDDWGAATVNIKASDITFMNLTVINDYGIRTGDNTHQFALRLMQGSRIITENSSFIAGGADTVSLWNKQDGMYYHRRAHFEGYTDFVCPRGWSYITSSTFFSRGGAAAIWHDGAADPEQKLVIRESSFDGVEGFILGRRHYDAQFYLVDNHYSANMADTPIFRKTYEDISRNRPNLWGDRYYFSGSVKEGTPFTWLQNNMASDLPEMTPELVFDGKWNPEMRLAEFKVQIALYKTSHSAR